MTILILIRYDNKVERIFRVIGKKIHILNKMDNFYLENNLCYKIQAKNTYRQVL